MKFTAALWTVLWRRGDRGDRAQLVFFGLALVVVGLGFLVDFDFWVYLLIYAGIGVAVLRSYLALRKSHRALQETLTAFQREQEIRYFEWLHDASPDD